MAKDLALLVLRLSGFGLAFAHGWQKVAMLSSGNADPFVDRVEVIGFPLPIVFAWAAALSEFVGGLCIAFGIATRVAASFAAFTVFVASFFRHRLAQQILVWVGASSYPQDVIDSWGDPERAATYLLIFLALVLMGGGGFSVHRLIRGGGKRR